MLQERDDKILGISEFCGFHCKPVLQRKLINATVLAEDLSHLSVGVCSSIPCELINMNTVTLFGVQ